MTPLLGFGLSMISSFVMGKLKKKAAPLPNDSIPLTNATITGGTAAGLTGGDPETTLAAVAGAMAANTVHLLWKKFFKI